jgi:hypothetical protein
MLSMTLNTGDGLQIGEGPDAGAFIRIADKSGRRVKLAIATDLTVKRLAPGISPAQFTTGVTGRQVRILAATG